jgi:voltage-gated potassium channel
MKSIIPQLIFFAQNKTTQRNLVVLSKFFVFLLLIICLYSVLFHGLMMYEDRYYSWVTGFYWTMTVMSTLGFGDITFHTDIGLLFTIVVLVSGILFLLIILPFTFIQFFYAPWLDAQEKARTPRKLPPETNGHVIITKADAITIRLIENLRRYDIPYVVVSGDLQEANTLLNAGYRVVLGELDLPATYQKLQVDKAALVVVSNDDLISTNICFTIREIDEEVPIVTNAENENSIDILEFSGNTSVFEFMKMLGESLSMRTYGVGRSTNIIGRFDDLMISEMPVMHTILENHSLAESGIRKATGVNVIGLSERGRFSAATPQSVLSHKTILILAGSSRQFKAFDEQFRSRYEPNPKGADVLILGGGRVGQTAAATLASHNISYRIVEKRKAKADQYDAEHTIVGDAADINVLKEAGIESAKSVIVTTHSDDINIYLTFYCRQLRPDIQIVSRSILERNVNKLHVAGADQVMSYASLGAGTIFRLLRPNDLSLFTEGLSVLHRAPGSDLAGQSIMQSRIREKTGFSVIAIRREKEGMLISPAPETIIREDDLLIAIGTSENKELFLQL